EHDETGAGELGGRLEVHQAQRFAYLEVLPWLVGPGELWRLTDAADLLVVVLVLADRHLLARQVGDNRERRGENLVGLGLSLLACGKLILERGHLGHQ